MKLTDAQLDRAAGVLLGQAAGDALGVPYEFALDGKKIPAGFTPEMKGGGLGPYEPGEWSDDTQMALVIALELQRGADVRRAGGLDRVALGFLHWLRTGASDVGAQTRGVLEATDRFLDEHPDAVVSAKMHHAASQLHQRTGRSAGNGSLMRTAPIALRYLRDPVAMADAAYAVSKLTHYDDLAAEACVIWCSAIREAVLSGTVGGIPDSMSLLPPGRRDFWAGKLQEAVDGRPSDFTPNGFVVAALQAAWSAVMADPLSLVTPSEMAFRTGIVSAVKAGDDTDTVAAIAGGLLGGLCGAEAVPAHWRKLVNGWPSGMTARDLVKLGQALAVLA
jgi:ADP-ribosylglycohydrolase